MNPHTSIIYECNPHSESCMLKNLFFNDFYEDIIILEVETNVQLIIMEHCVKHVKLYIQKIF